MIASPRLATAADLDRLEAIETDADALLIELFDPTEWNPACSGEERAAEPGFVLVAVDDHDRPTGFVHVLETAGYAHLEQLSVLRAHARRGHGRRLVEAAKDHARERGYDRMSLRTFAEVPWNAPFYARLGFVEEEPASAFHLALIETERRLGLDALGRRVQMGARL